MPIGMFNGQLARYGIDAPPVIGWLLALGLVSLAFALACRSAGVIYPAIGLIAIGATLWTEAALMLRYSMIGKFRHRDRMLGRIVWSGDERVLDVGTGRGLLLVGAAKRLTTGRAIGIDIWSRQDLSGNAIGRTRANLAAEGVAERCQLSSEAAQRMSFPDGSFDVVLSNLCLHNIGTAPERRRACDEIVRVLKPGGTAVISDYRFTRAYAETFASAGLSVSLKGPYWRDTFPPLNIVVAEKAVVADRKNGTSRLGETGAAPAP